MKGTSSLDWLSHAPQRGRWSQKDGYLGKVVFYPDSRLKKHCKMLIAAAEIVTEAKTHPQSPSSSPESSESFRSRLAPATTSQGTNNEDSDSGSDLQRLARKRRNNRHGWTKKRHLSPLDLREQPSNLVFLLWNIMEDLTWMQGLISGFFDYCFPVDFRMQMRRARIWGLCLCQVCLQSSCWKHTWPSSNSWMAPDQ